MSTGQLSGISYPISQFIELFDNTTYKIKNPIYFSLLIIPNEVRMFPVSELLHKPSAFLQIHRSLIADDFLPFP